MCPECKQEYIERKELILPSKICWWCDHGIWLKKRVAP